MTEKLPADIPESIILSTIQTRAEDFLKEFLGSDKSESESNQQDAHDISAADNDSSKLENAHDKSAADNDSSKLENAHDKSAADNDSSKLENAHEKSAADDDSSKLENIGPVEHAAIVRVDSCLGQSKLEYLQHAVDISTSNSGNFELQDHRIEDNADVVGVDHCQNKGNSLEEINKPTLESELCNSTDTATSDSETSKLQERIHEKIDETARVDQSESEINVCRETNGSCKFSGGEEVSPQNSENSSTSLDSSRHERLPESQFFEKFQSGVYVLLTLRADGIKIFKRVKFR